MSVVIRVATIYWAPTTCQGTLAYHLFPLQPPPSILSQLRESTYLTQNHTTSNSRPKIQIQECLCSGLKMAAHSLPLLPWRGGVCFPPLESGLTCDLFWPEDCGRVMCITSVAGPYEICSSALSHWEAGRHVKHPTTPRPSCCEEAGWREEAVEEPRACKWRLPRPPGRLKCSLNAAAEPVLQLILTLWRRKTIYPRPAWISDPQNHDKLSIVVQATKHFSH